MDDRFARDPALETGVEQVDSQHRRLFALASTLSTCSLDESCDEDTITDAIYSLTEYVTEHFADEEALMSQASYPGLGPHRSRHEQLTADTMRFVARFFNGERVAAEELSEFVAQWLTTHIERDDKVFAAWLREQQRP
ncbi:bacteriohemerythrin [Coriobacteriaceae bacterium EMTCatB1]|nr:bacteriohemerythrin [Coriobacteriaceae bacterium EMTCatB1]